MPRSSKEPSTGGGIQSAEIGIRVLSTLAGGIGPMSLKAVADGAGLSASNTRRYLVSLMRSGMVDQDPATGNYDLGPLALRIGLAALYRVNVVRAAIPILATLRDEVGETAMLSIWGDHGPTVVHWEESLPPIIINLRIGSVLPLLSSATGRVFLAWLPKQLTGKLVSQELKRVGGRSRIDVKAITQETRETGIGRFGTEDPVRSVSSIAAPIFNHEARLVGAVAIFGPGESFDNAAGGEPAEMLLGATRAISEKMGARS
ncbi:MAG: IclR family transcriptional regulator [Bauldia litoralis]